MILDVTEKYHDYGPQEYLLDTDKLNPNNYVDNCILQKIAKDQKLKYKVYIDATHWEERSKFGNTEPHVSENAKVTDVQPTAVLNLKIYFDC